MRGNDAGTGRRYALQVLTPAPHLVKRFRENLEALAGTSVPRLGLAVSGGPDSLAMLLLAAAAYPGAEAATVDHRLRPENADEAAAVATLCAALGIRHETLRVEVALTGEGLQSAARHARYAALGEWASRRSLPALLTAHHADDQAETLLMRLARGSGLPGLASIRARRSEGAIEIVRPLLGWTRATLRTVIDDAGLTSADDPSNRSPDHDRTHVRALLTDTPLLDPERLAASASHLANCEDALDWAAACEWKVRHGIEKPGSHSIAVVDLPRELRRRLAARAIDEVRRENGLAADWRRDGIGRLLDRLDMGATATLAHVKCSGGPVWRFQATPPRRAPRPVS